MADVNRTIVVKRLDALNDEDRMLLLNKYAQQTEDIYCTFSADKNIDVISKIFLFKFNKEALVDSYMKGDPVVDHPDCRFDEFINNEMAA